MKYIVATLSLLLLAIGGISGTFYPQKVLSYYGKGEENQKPYELTPKNILEVRIAGIFALIVFILVVTLLLFTFITS